MEKLQFFAGRRNGYGSAECLWPGWASRYYPREHPGPASIPTLPVVPLPIEERPAPAPLRRTLTARQVALASVTLYVLSLALPAIHEVGLGIDPDRGFMILATGMMGFMFLQMGWFANVFWVLGMVALGRNRWGPAAVRGALAVVVAADSFVLYETGFPSDSGASHAVTLMYGFWVWWASLWVLAAGALLLWRRARAAEVAVDGSRTAADFHEEARHGA